MALDKLLFRALNRYLLKNSSSIETEMRSLILPPIRIHIVGGPYLSLYVGFEDST